MPKIKDIAELMGVSSATVSYALNGNSNISLRTRKRVLDVAKKINYQPTRKANPSAKKKIKSLAFVSCLPFDPWGESYWGEFLKGCLDAAHQVNCVLQVAQINPEKNLDIQLPIVLREEMVDGMIITGWPDQMLINKLAEKNIPSVLLDTHDLFSGFHHVRPDHKGGIYKAVNHLYELGHRRIAVIAGDMTFACEKTRCRAYEQAMSDLGLEWEDSWIIKHPRLCENAGIEGMKTIIDNKLDVTAILCHGDSIARGAMTIIKERGMSVPDDFSIIGIDNQPFAKHLTPSLTTIDVMLTELGETAVAHLIELMKKPEMSPRCITIEAKLILRNSTVPHE